MNHIPVTQLSDGSYITYGRNASYGGVRGEGPALHYSGEAAEVIALLLKYTKA